MIELVRYDPEWPRRYEILRTSITDVLGSAALASTAIPGLIAKPIIDIDVLMDPDALGNVIDRLSMHGYVHEGDLGIRGREAFKSPAGSIAHHLYVCAYGTPKWDRKISSFVTNCGPIHRSRQRMAS